MAGLLIVEDEAIVALDLASQVQAIGHQVLGIADNAADAIRLACEKLPDLVLMDVVIKGDVDGVQAAQVIQRDLQVPVIFLTAYSDTRTVDRLTQIGPFGYLTKPFLARELKSTIQLAVYKGQIDANLRESQHWLMSALASVADGVIASDEFGQVHFLNPAAERLTGWSSADAEGRLLRDVMRLAGAALQSPATLLTKAGDPVPIEWTSKAILGVRGHMLGEIVTMRERRPS
jgi:CheY-like chemotaxis protein